MENNVNTKVKTGIYFFDMDLAKLEPNEAAKITKYAVGDKLSKNVIDIKLLEVRRESKNVTKHFELEKDGSKFMLYFDEEMTKKILASGRVHIYVVIKETIAL